MPSGKTHDLLTLFLCVPAAAGLYVLTSDVVITAVAAAAFLFGGFVFGPDLDTVSKQYSRWGPLRFIWFPYRAFFKHRSRWTHGLLFGTLIRVVYFLGIATIVIIGGACLFRFFAGGGGTPGIGELEDLWRAAGATSSAVFGDKIPFALFAGMWSGAASHTLTDITVSYVRTGRVDILL